jgi:heterodisulfide reductase subunit B
MKYTYFPGCSLKSTEIAYEQSLKLSSEALGIQLQELADWNCCGATLYPGLNKKAFLALAARNFALAEKNKADLVTACNGCFTALGKANFYLRQNKDYLKKLNNLLSREGLKYQGNIRVRHFLEVIINDVGLIKIESALKRKLSTIKVACYYGCQFSRPLGLEYAENPGELEKLFAVLGAEVVDFSAKTDCCGGAVVLSEEDACLKLLSGILRQARALNADCLVTICPLCQINLQLYQRKIGIFMPVIYFTQALAYCLGVDFSRLGKEFLPLKNLVQV